MTDLLTRDPNDSGDIPPLPGEHHARIQVTNPPGEYGVRRLIGESTANMTKRRLRSQGVVYTPASLRAADTMVVRTDLHAVVETAPGMRGDEQPIFDLRDPYEPDWRDTWIHSQEIPQPSTFSQMLDAGLQEPPTGTPPPLPPQPSTPAKADGRPVDFRPAHRRSTPAGPLAVLAVGVGMFLFAAGWVSCWAVAL